MGFELPIWRSPLSLFAVADSLQEIISDDFSGDASLWLNGSLVAATNLLVSGGQATINSTGTERNTGSNAAADPNATEADATTGITAGPSLTLASQNTDVHTGSYALRATASDGLARFAYIQKFDFNVNLWARVDFQHKRGTQGTTQAVSAVGGFSTLPAPNSTASFTRYLAARRPTDASSAIRFYAIRTTGAAGDNIVIDNLSILELTDASIFAVRQLDFPISSVKAALTTAQYTQSGVVLFQDSNNFMLAYLDRIDGTVKLVKRVGGTYAAALGSGAVTYGAGNILQLTPNAAGDEFTVSYNGTPVLTSVYDNDLDFSTGTWYAGLFATETSNVFDNFEAAKI